MTSNLATIIILLILFLMLVWQYVIVPFLFIGVGLLIGWGIRWLLMCLLGPPRQKT